MSYAKNKRELEKNGYSTIANLYTKTEVEQILNCLEHTAIGNNSFMKTKDLFAIRQLLKTIPGLADLLFNAKLNKLLKDLTDSTYFLTKAIYFDKPPDSNWFVAYHQDLSISVNKKMVLNDYENWTFKKGQYGVQPPLEILEDMITIRIHLDNTDKKNGALRVIKKSHINGIVRVDKKDWDNKNEVTCKVEKGGVMLMKPLTLHASSRSSNNKQRRIIHLEFNKHELAKPLEWLEYHAVKT